MIKTNPDNHIYFSFPWLIFYLFVELVDIFLLFFFSSLEFLFETPVNIVYQTREFIFGGMGGV